MCCSCCGGTGCFLGPGVTAAADFACGGPGFLSGALNSSAFLVQASIICAKLGVAPGEG